MLDLDHIQSKAYDLISAATYLDSVTILKDDGEQNDALSLAHRETGAAVVVRQPDSMAVQAYAAGMAFGTASLSVLVSINKEVNDYSDSGAAVDPERVVREIKTAMEAYDATALCSFFHLSGEQLLSTEGLYERQLTFSAWATA